MLSESLRRDLLCFDCDEDYEPVSPPHDEGDFFELSMFFDGKDNEGNLLVNDEEKGGNLVRINSSSHQSRISKDSCDDYSWLREADHGGYNPKKKVKEAKTKPPKSNGVDNGGSRLSGTFNLKKCQNLTQCFAFTSSMKSDKPGMAKKVQQKPLIGPVENNMKSLDDNSFQIKIEVTKRRLQERYLEADNAKKQRTNKIIKLEDLPKQGFNHQRSQPKKGNTAKAHGRLWPNGR
ncbi:hypothetical protein ZOSMA_597G00040 [Zostera marina]|uniref:Uncharacterized protein n=1 Tax=Zostera marina TaxID=29655 RepID=A0A0K9NUS6_ZOSMR|nr:hypothetical protein ZOSMA_597G00040 [Zostera marina]